MEDVIVTDATIPGVPQGQGKDEQVTITKTEFERLNRELNETRQSERAWADRAMRSSDQVHPGAQMEEKGRLGQDDDLDVSQFEDPDLPDALDDDTPEKLVDEISKLGTKALEARGYVRAKDVQRIALAAAKQVSREVVGRAEQRVVTDSKIFTEFPDLKNQDSELFKETSKIFRAAVAMDKNALKTPSAMYLSAKAASAAISAKAAKAKPAEDDDFEPESERRLRSASQDGRTRGRGEIEDADDMMGSQAKEVARRMGITEQEFQQYKKAGRAK